MNRLRSNPASRGPRALASVLLLAVAWLLPGLHGMWCDHGHGPAEHGPAGERVAHSERSDSHSHSHGCGAVVHEHEADPASAPEEDHEGQDLILPAPSPVSSCVLDLLAPVPGTDFEADPLGAGQAPLARSQLLATGASTRAVTRHLLAPKNSPPVDGRRRQA